MIEKQKLLKLVQHSEFRFSIYQENEVALFVHIFKLIAKHKFKF